MTPKTFWRSLFVISCGAFSAHVAAADVSKSATTVPWSYVGTTGPQHWGMLDSSFVLCDTGRSQSPINIVRKRTPAPYQLKLEYHSTAMFIGEDLENQYKVTPSQTVLNTGYGIQLNFHDKERELLTFAGNDYELIQLHFHSPSETLWHKQSFPLEIHMVHQGSEGLLVLAIFVKGGDENPVLNQVLSHLPEKEKQEYPVAGVRINPADLLPDNQRYYAYMGSLTTPPCSEGVQWVVMPQAIFASPAQILKIREASGGTNARPVQPLNGRTLHYAVP